MWRMERVKVSRNTVCTFRIHRALFLPSQWVKEVPRNSKAVHRELIEGRVKACSEICGCCFIHTDATFSFFEAMKKEQEKSLHRVSLKNQTQRGHRMNFKSIHFPFQGINRSTPWHPIIEKRTLLPINRANPTQPFTRSRQAPKTPSNCNIVQTHAPTTYLIFASNLLTSWWCPRVVYSACARGAYYIVLYIYQFTVKVLWSCEEAEMRSLNAIKIMLNKAKANENQV